MTMTHKFSHPVMARGDDGNDFQVAELDVEVDIYGLRGEWMVGEIRLWDIANKRTVPVASGDKGFGRSVWRRLREDFALRSMIDIEWIAHVNSHGEDGLLDVAEMQFRHNYEARP